MPVTNQYGPAFAGESEDIRRRLMYKRRTVVSPRPRLISDFRTPVPRSVPARPSLVAQGSQSIQAAPAMWHEPAPRPVLTATPTGPAANTAAASRSRFASFHGRVLTGIAVLLILGGAFIAWNGLRTNRNVEAQVKQLSERGDDNNNTTSNEVPSETKPGGTSSYRVAPTLPRALRIPKLGVDARVVRLGIKVNNELAAPHNIFDTGWYDGSAKPGEAGAMLIDGHASGPSKHGVFYALKTLKPGDMIEVERGDGKVFKYKVVSSKAYPADKVDMAAALTPITPGKPGLNLITCTGKVAASRTTFEDRLLVFAEQQ